MRITSAGFDVGVPIAMKTRPMHLARGRNRDDCDFYLSNVWQDRIAQERDSTGAKIRCSGCQTSFSPDSGKTPNEGVTDSLIEQFIGPPISSPLPDSLVQDDEPMGAPARPQRSSHTAQSPSVSRDKLKPPESSTAASEPPKLTSKSSENSEKSSLLLILTYFPHISAAISSNFRRSSDSVSS